MVSKRKRNICMISRKAYDECRKFIISDTVTYDESQKEMTTKERMSLIFNSLSNYQRDEQIIYIINGLHSRGKIKDEEAEQALADIKTFAENPGKSENEISPATMKVFAIMPKFVRYDVGENYYTIKFVGDKETDYYENFANVMRQLPEDMKVRAMSFVITRMQCDGLITPFETNEALADVIKCSLFENALGTSNGIRRVMYFIEQGYVSAKIFNGFPQFKFGTSIPEEYGVITFVSDECVAFGANPDPEMLNMFADFLALREEIHKQVWGIDS